MTGMNIAYALDEITCAASELVKAHDKLIEAKDALESDAQADALSNAKNALKNINFATALLRATIKHGWKTPKRKE